MAAHIRLLYPGTVRPSEVEAAGEALERLARFGVTHDRIQLEAGVLKPVRKVKHGEKLHSIVTNPGAVIVSPLDLHAESISCLWYDKDIIGIGLTPWRMHESEGFPDEKSRRIGLSLFGHGALVSLQRLRETEGGMRLMAIRLAVAHEAGHVLIERKGHCGQDGCLMQENENHRDFIDRFVRPALDFCRACEAEIRRGVSKLESARYS